MAIKCKYGEWLLFHLVTVKGLLNGVGDAVTVGGERKRAPWIISTIGVALAGLSFWYLVVFKAVGPSSGQALPVEVLELLEVLLLVAFSAILVYSGYWLASSQFDDRLLWWTGLWTLLGLAGIVGLVGLVQSTQLHSANGIDTSTFLGELLLAAGGGSFAGLLIGISSMKATQNREKVADQRDTMAFMNELLRHNVLNGMQIILGHSATLREETESERVVRHVDTIESQGTDIVELVENVRTLSKAVSNDTSFTTVNLSSILREGADKLRAAHDVTVETEIPDNVHVRADDLLPAVFDNLLSNAVEHNDATHPRVRVTVERRGEVAVATIADNGPGIPETNTDRVFEPGRKRDRSFGQGMGLYLVDTLVDHYGGSVWVENGQQGAARQSGADSLDGAVFHVSLPTAGHDG